MRTATERYRGHQVWEAVKLKREALNTARFSDRNVENRRENVVDWLSEAEKTKLTPQPALYLGVLDELLTVINGLSAGESDFHRYLEYGGNESRLIQALRALPLPPPKPLAAAYVELLDREVEARTVRLDELEERISATERSLEDRMATLTSIEKTATGIQSQIDRGLASLNDAIRAVDDEMGRSWGEALHDWHERRREFDDKQDALILSHVATLAATARAGEALAEHAAGTLSASDWNARAKRERRAAQWLRTGSMFAFISAVGVGVFIVSEAIANNFDLTVGDGILRASVAAVIGAFGALLMRESGRHFREADAAEDVALSLKALAPFYASAQDDVRLAARVQVGDAVLVKNVLSRFAHRDAAKHAGEINTQDLPSLVSEATKALRRAEQPGTTS